MRVLSNTRSIFLIILCSSPCSTGKLLSIPPFTLRDPSLMLAFREGQNGREFPICCVDGGGTSQAGLMVEEASAIAVLLEVDRVLMFRSAGKSGDLPGMTKSTIVHDPSSLAGER